MHSALGFFPALSTIEPSLQSSSQRRVRQHSGETYNRREGEKPALVGHQRPHPGDCYRPRQRSERSEECNTPAGTGWHLLSTKQVTRRGPTPRTDRSGPGVGGSHGQRRGDDPESLAASEEGSNGGYPPVGQDLPMVATGALGSQPGSRIRTYPGNDTASYKESEECRAPGEAGPGEDGRPDRGRGQGAGTGQGVESKGEQGDGPTDQKAAG
jgi:hypothetical protein